MHNQTWNNVFTRVHLGLLSVSFVLPVSVFFAPAEAFSSDLYKGKSGIEKIDNRVGKDAVSKSTLKRHSRQNRNAEFSEETAVWNQRMRRNWSAGGSAVSGQACSKKSPCSSIAIGKGATANTGTVTVDGTKGKGSVDTKSNIKQSSNMAIGNRATANMGSVNVQGSNIKGAINNQSNVKQSVNKAIGKGATANMGSVSVQGSNIKGVINNQSDVQQSVNEAIGKGATANMGSVSVQGSKVKGAVANESQVKQSSSKARGDGASANMGSITIE